MLGQRMGRVRCSLFHLLIHTLFARCHVECPCCGRCVNCSLWGDDPEESSDDESI